MKQTKLLLMMSGGKNNRREEGRAEKIDEGDLSVLPHQTVSPHLLNMLAFCIILA